MKCPNCGGPRGKDERCCSYCDTWFEPEKLSDNKQEIHIHYHQESRGQVEHVYTPMEKRSTRNRIVALVLCIFLGFLGVHKFYLGKIGMGILYFFTHGLFGVGWLVDMIILLCGNPRDKEGNRLTWH